VLRRSVDGPREPLRDAVAVGAPASAPRAAAPAFAAALASAAGNTWRIVPTVVQTVEVFLSLQLDLALLLGAFLEAAGPVVLITLLAATRLPVLLLAAIFSKLCAQLEAGIQGAPSLRTI